MAETDITPTALSINTVSADILDTDGAVATTPTDGWNVLALGHSGDRLLLKFWDDGNTATCTIKAGVRPPAQREGLGDLAVVLAANDVRYICVEGSRFLRANGTILVIPSGTGSAATECKAFIIPKVA